ncbi:uncharacterized protein LOC111615805 [Centruroides sculpturatus]|uniref:uncharacterized protein LOC111615805 n=1 Tax=Centruroides sculpturatus TaxID=218467 RepID=UPI000C6E497B|nr:uncharacterized protein LOC111615805 [Centruroides sculpturatus]
MYRLTTYSSFIIYLCFIVYSNEQNVTESEVPVPTRIILDESEMASLRDQAMANASISLSNTSLSDLQNDNDTIRLHQQYRERNREKRLQAIKKQILERRRISSSLNSTFPALTQTEIDYIAQTYDRLRRSSIIPGSATTTAATTESNDDNR